MTGGEFVLETERLRMRRPWDDDARAIFDAYASDAEVTRYLGWTRHKSVHDTRTFLELSHFAWKIWPVGPLLIESRDDGSLLGSTGLDFDAADRAGTGYVIVRHAWGRGLASEALGAMVSLASSLGVRRLHAFCHVDHLASRRVLERCDFEPVAVLAAHMIFPNLADASAQDVCRYERAC